VHSFNYRVSKKKLASPQYKANLFLDIRNIVNGYAGKLENVGIAPHDLRRTFAKLAHKGGSPIDQIQLSLGHDSIQTTEKYLGVEQDLTDAPCDHLSLRIS